MKNKLLFGVVVLFLLISVQQTKAAEINELNDTSTSKNLTYDGSDSYLDYISIYKYANISKAEWNLTGYAHHEETHLSTSESGGGSYIVDVYWQGQTFKSGSTLRLLWVIPKVGCVGGDCSGLPNLNLSLTSTTAGGKPNYTDIIAVNTNVRSNTSIVYFPSLPLLQADTTYALVFSTTDTSAGADFMKLSKTDNYPNGSLFYSEDSGGNWTDFGWDSAMNIRLGLYPENITIDTGNDGINDYVNATIFNSEERIDLNTTAIHNYLGSCSSDPCDVPFNISSDTEGTLEISAINITYDEYDAITDCSGDNDSPSLIFEHFHEGSLDEINASLDITFEATVYGNQTDNYSFTFPENHSHTICISPAWASYISDAFGVYYSATHSQRSFYLAGGTLTNSTQTINLYSLNTTESDAVVIYVKDVTGLFVEDVYMKIQRYYPGTGTYNTVAYMRTDEDGKDMTYLYLNDVYYKFILELNGVIEREISPRTITDSVDDPEVIIFSLYGSGIEYFQIEDINYGCTYNNATFLLRCTVSDSTNLMTESCLRTERLEILSSTLINESCETDSAVTYIHNITNTTGDYIYTLTISTNSNDYNVITGSINVPGTASAFGDWGIFIVFLIVMVAGGLGMVYPPAGGVFAVLGLIVGIYAGFVDIAISSVVGLLLVAGIYLIKGKS